VKLQLYRRRAKEPAPGQAPLTTVIIGARLLIGAVSSWDLNVPAPANIP